MEKIVLEKSPIQFAGGAAGLEKFFKLENWRVKVGDREDDRIIWRRGAFVLIVAVTPEQKVVVIREYKQAAEEILLGLPAGAIKKGETPQSAAARELREETGYNGTCTEVLGPFLNSPDKSTEKHYVVFISNAVKSGLPTPEYSETILGVELLELGSAKYEMKIGLHRMAVQEVLGIMAEGK